LTNILEFLRDRGGLRDIASADSISIPPIAAILPRGISYTSVPTGAIEKFELPGSADQEDTEGHRPEWASRRPTSIRALRGGRNHHEIENVRAIGAVLTRMIDIALAAFCPLGRAT